MYDSCLCFTASHHCKPTSPLSYNPISISKQPPPQIASKNGAVINQHLFTPTGTRLITCPFTFYHMTTHMILSFLSHYLCLSLLSLIYIPMESSRISITPYDDTLLIVLTCSTLIPTYAKSS